MPAPPLVPVILELELTPLLGSGPAGLACLRVCDTSGECLREYWRPAGKMAVVVETLGVLATIKLVTCPNTNDYAKLYAYPHLQRLLRRINGYDQFLSGS